jgi:GTP1/Obg family GTP-binding protein
MSPRLDEKDLRFLQVLTANEPAFNERLNDYREIIDVMLDVKSVKKSFSQVNTKIRVT